MNLFEEVNRTNRAYCQSLGLPSGAYAGSIEDENEGYRDAMLDKPSAPTGSALRQERYRRGYQQAIQDIADAELAAYGPRAIVEYARKPAPTWETMNLDPYYESCRSGYTQRAGVWVGD